jgi:SagB-type dehydrogenase family enzyme
MDFPWHKIEGSRVEDDLWMLFHENSKKGKQDPRQLSASAIKAVFDFWDDLPYEGYQRVLLPDELAAMDLSIGRALLEPTAALDSGAKVTLAQLGTMLYCSQVPGGEAASLELYIHATRVEGLDTGLYHFHRGESRFDLILPGDSSGQIGSALDRPELALDSALTIFITAVFERAVAALGNRGYRVALLEAGQAARNVNFAAAGLNVPSVNTSAFVDREIDALLGLDGIAHSTLIIVSVGQNQPA